MGTHWSTTQLGGWMMDLLLVDLSFHVRALNLLLIVLFSTYSSPQNCIKVAFSGLENSG